MWYLAILVAFGVSIVNGQPNNPVNRLNCNLTPLPTSQYPGARTTTTATYSQQEICRCFANNPNYLPSDRFVAQATDSSGRAIVYDRTIGEMCDPRNQDPQLRFLFPRGSTTYRVRGFVTRNGIIIADTDESTITLRIPQDYRTIDTNTTHGASMIAITSILPILFALSLAMFTSMLFMSCCCCHVFKPTKCQQENKEKF